MDQCVYHVASNFLGRDEVLVVEDLLRHGSSRLRAIERRLPELAPARVRTALVSLVRRDFCKSLPYTNSNAYAAAGTCSRMGMPGRLSEFIEQDRKDYVSINPLEGDCWAAEYEIKRTNVLCLLFLARFREAAAARFGDDAADVLELILVEGAMSSIGIVKANAQAADMSTKLGPERIEKAVQTLVAARWLKTFEMESFNSISGENDDEDGEQMKKKSPTAGAGDSLLRLDEANSFLSLMRDPSSVLKPVEETPELLFLNEHLKEDPVSLWQRERQEENNFRRGKGKKRTREGKLKTQPEEKDDDDDDEFPERELGSDEIKAREDPLRRSIMLRNHYYRRDCRKEGLKYRDPPHTTETNPIKAAARPEIFSEIPDFDSRKVYMPHYSVLFTRIVLFPQISLYFAERCGDHLAGIVAARALDLSYRLPKSESTEFKLVSHVNATKVDVADALEWAQERPDASRWLYEDDDLEARVRVLIKAFEREANTRGTCDVDGDCVILNLEATLWDLLKESARDHATVRPNAYVVPENMYGENINRFAKMDFTYREIWHILEKRGMAEAKLLDDLMVEDRKHVLKCLYYLKADDSISAKELAHRSDRQPAQTVFAFFVDYAESKFRLMERNLKSVANALVRRNALVKANEKLYIKFANESLKKIKAIRNDAETRAEVSEERRYCKVVAVEKSLFMAVDRIAEGMATVGVFDDYLHHTSSRRGLSMMELEDYRREEDRALKRSLAAEQQHQQS